MSREPAPPLHPAALQAGEGRADPGLFNNDRPVWFGRYDKWRRGRDSNPRRGLCPLNRLAGGSFQPAHAPLRARHSIQLAEGVGFEPTDLSVNGFQDRRLRPLGHPSATTSDNCITTRKLGVKTKAGRLRGLRARLLQSHYSSSSSSCCFFSSRISISLCCRSISFLA